MQFQVELDRVIAAGANRDFLTAQHRDGHEISVLRGIDDGAIDTSFFERLAAQIQHSRPEIEQTRQTKVAIFRLVPIQSIALYAVTFEGEMSHSLFVSIRFVLFNFDGAERIGFRHGGIGGV